MQLHEVHYVVQRSCFVFVIKIVVVMVVCVFYKHLVSSKMLNFRSRKYKLNFSNEMNWKCTCNYFFKTLFVLFHVCVCILVYFLLCVCVCFKKCVFYYYKSHAKPEPRNYQSLYYRISLTLLASDSLELKLS